MENDCLEWMKKWNGGRDKGLEHEGDGMMEVTYSTLLIHIPSK